MKDFIDHFMNVYHIDLDYINYNNVTIASPIDGDKDYDKSIEQLIEEKLKKPLDTSIKYIKLEISGSIDDAEAITPIIKYVLK